MNSKIRDYIEKLFEDAPRTRRALELREEIIANAEEKYQDLLKDGCNEEEAFAMVIHSIGDVQELFWELEQEEGGSWYYEQELILRERKARFTAIAVGLYIFAGAVFFVFEALGSTFRFVEAGTWGIAIAVLLCVAPTCMLIYVCMLSTGGKKDAERIAQPSKEAAHNPDNRKAVRKLVSSIIWTLTLILYFVISFDTGAWYITWVIFLVAGCVESAVALFFNLKR